jgi:hypothetical protein
MFKIEVTKLDGEVEHIYNMNKKEDNFLKFIPKMYGVPATNMKAFMMDDEEIHELEAYLKLPNHVLDKGQEGKLVVVKLTKTFNEVTEVHEETSEVIKEYVGSLIEYPYDELGNFMGNGRVNEFSS